jgi:death-on-curing protein
VTIYLDVEDLLHIAERTLAGIPEIRDVGLLHSSSARPQTFAFGHDAYPTLPDKAAALLHSIVGNHALVDGNKRLGFAAMAVFCEINGQRLTMSNEAAYQLTMSVARGELDAPEIAAALRHAGIS